MEKKIKEVQDYFTKRIENCEFDLVKIKLQESGWFWFKVTIDSYPFKFSVHPTKRLFCLHEVDTFMMISDMPDERLDNLISFIEDKEQEFKAQEIAKLKEQLKELES